MGYKNKKYYKGLIQQAQDKLERMLHNGEGTSKREAVKNGSNKDKIFAYKTYKTYFKQAKKYCEWIKGKYPECRNLKSAKKYVNEWLQSLVDYRDEKGNPYSASTIKTRQEALVKLYGLDADDPDYFKAPKRYRADAKRSRTAVERDKHFSETNNDLYIRFCKSIGCRYNVARKLIGKDFATRTEIEIMLANLLRRESIGKEERIQIKAIKECLEVFPDQDAFVFHRKDKGGRYRYAPVIGKDKNLIIQRFRATAPDDKIWLHIPSAADTHSYRADYATSVYKMYARPIEEIPFDAVNKGTGKKYQSGVYVCRKDEKGKKLDKEALFKTSKALGHNRLDVVANSYLRGI